MPFDLAQSLQTLGLAAEAGMEVQRQIAVNTGNINRLLEVGFPPLDAEIIAGGITAGAVNPNLLAEASTVNAVAVEIAKGINTPRNTVLPTITGTAQVGQTLTSTTGTWTGTGNTFTRRWTADGVTISGATAATYVPVTGDIGKVIRVVVTNTRNGLVSEPATSAPTAAVIAA